MANVSVTVDANTSNFDKALRRAGNRLESFGDKAREVGSNMSQWISLPMAAAAGAAVKSAADFESAIVELQKVTNQETANKLSGSIREMSEAIPLAQNELAGLAADAARFGVRGTENIESFTEAVAKMAEATDLSASQAGQALAKISEQAGVQHDEIENLGSAINELSNNFATSSSEIVDSMLRGSAAASNFGLSAQEIAGVSGQMNAMSESAERAGTRIRALFQEMLNPKKIGDIANAIGMSKTAFIELRNESPRRALMEVVNAMSEGGQAANNLRSTLQRTARTAVTALAKNSEDLTKAMDMSGQAFEENTSLQKEFDAATKTFNARLTKAINKLRNVGITIGNRVIPYVLDLIDGVKGVIDWFGQLEEGAQNNIIKIGALAAAIGPVVAGLGLFSTAMSAAIGGLKALTAAMLSNPWTALATAIAAAGSALYLFSQRTEDATEKQTALEKAQSKASEMFGKQAGEAQTLFNQLKYVNEGTDEYRKIIEKINSKYGKFLDNQLDEKSNLDEIRKARDKVLDGMREEIRVKAAQETQQKILSEEVEQQSRVTQKLAKETDLERAAAQKLVSQYLKRSDMADRLVDQGYAQFDAFVKARDAIKVNENALDELDKKEVEVNGEMRTGESILEQLSIARSKNRREIDAMNEALRGSADATEDANKSNKDAKDGMKETEQAAKGAKDAIKELSKVQRNIESPELGVDQDSMSGGKIKVPTEMDVEEPPKSLFQKMGEDALENATKFVDAQKQIRQSIDGVVRQQMRAADTQESVGERIRNAVTSTIKAQIAEGVATTIAGALKNLAPALGPAAVPIAAAAGAAASALLNSAIPEFAEGGIVSGDTVLRAGEYPGASSNPEIIAPLNKLESMMPAAQGTSVPKEIRVIQEGKDLTGIMNRNRRTRKRKSL